jgi:hypothetical protein
MRNGFYIRMPDLLGVPAVLPTLGPSSWQIPSPNKACVRKSSVLGVRMAKKRKPFYVAKERHAHGPVYECYQKKNGKTYKYFSVADVSGERRKCRTFSDAH